MALTKKEWQELQALDPETALMLEGQVKISDADAGSTPENPLPESPISRNMIERLKIGFGNDKGKVNYLKKKFEDAKLNKGGELVVKDKGQWKRVNPPGFDVGDVANLAGHSVVPAAGTAGALLSAPLAGGTPGAALGAMGGEAVRQIVGEMAGTQYTEAPEEAIKSMLAEGSIAGGTMLAFYGAGKGWQALKGPVKQGISKTLSITTGVPQDVVETAIDHPEYLKEGYKVKLPDGRIYKMTTGAINKLKGALAEAGDDIEKTVLKSPTLAEAGVDMNPVVAKINNEVGKYEGAKITRLNPTELAKVQDLLDDLMKGEGRIGAGMPSSLQIESGSYEMPHLMTFARAHEIKQAIYKEAQAYYKDPTYSKKVGDILATAAEEINAQLRNMSKEYGAANDIASTIYKTFDLLPGKLPRETAPAAKKLASMGSGYVKGTLKPAEEEVLNAVEETLRSTTGKSLIEPLTKVKAGYDLTSRVGPEFAKGGDPVKSAILALLAGSGGIGPTAMSAASGDIGGAAARAGGSLGTAGLAAALADPRLVGLGIRGANLAGKVARPVGRFLTSPPVALTVPRAMSGYLK